MPKLSLNLGGDLPDLIYKTPQPCYSLLYKGTMQYVHVTTPDAFEDSSHNSEHFCQFNLNDSHCSIDRYVLLVDKVVYSIDTYGQAHVLLCLYSGIHRDLLPQRHCQGHT